MRTVSIRLPECLDCRLTTLAKRWKTSRSTVLREALEELIARSPKFTVGELAADLIGSVEGPRDLSTNPKYMEGFGQSNRRGKTRRHRHHRRP
ncbi:MAG TPA: CopG family transcriptional regulator [Polyangiaceae bacterium]|nr:CopG family transcriptional regulator [Polyangiaceae bacterium]